MNEITVTQLAALPSPVVIDVREPDEFASGHVPGAINVPLGSLPGADLPEGPLHVICEMGGRSARATTALERQGRTATNIEGGTAAWREAGLPTTTEG
ncbi:rhodanese-like domain-containing protein [Subtercola boreus]|uniref:Sulfurtransferase n=1 Tax=Subtercola boreus TaxID=120213 RepID=A0A3E0WAI4_9MICO|nr:rhodanese-like domain-containing protein [Subtercola boreus]RFA19830.1 sulfurtransferase [Subtercola boreus]RFA19897.1 sulfurtransferase [Subtercola boreus]RFA26290.1 sulfurtransferase [Subtercola boreus]